MTMSVNYREAMVHMALSQIGNEAPTGDDRYIEFYNSIVGSDFSVTGTPWCAIFVTYCARHTGVPTSVIPNFASCTVSRDSFWKPNGRWVSRVEHNPRPGDIIYFDWANTRQGDCDHVGIVVEVTGTDVITVEGNTKGSSSVYGVRKKTYRKDWSQIIGYGVPDYEQTGGSVSDNENANDNTYTSMIKRYQSWINSKIDAGLILDGSYGPLTKTAAIRCYQTVLNTEHGKNLSVDGSYGPATRAAAVAITYGKNNNLVKCAQGQLYAHDLNPNGFDGNFGPGMLQAIKDFQKMSGLAADGSCGPDTWYYLYRKL